MVSYGNASGPVPPVDIGMLGAKGSLFLTRPEPRHLHRQARRPRAHGRRPVRRGASGAVKIRVNQTFPLKDAAAAHAALEGRRTTGSTVLLP